MAGEYSPAEIEAITTHVNKLAASPVFAQAERLVQFLRYVVKESLADRGEQVNQYALAMELYNRDESFDPATDSVVITPPCPTNRARSLLLGATTR